MTADSISRFIHTFITTALAAVVLTPAMAQGQTAADLFNPDVVQDLRLSINSRDNQELHEHSSSNCRSSRSTCEWPTDQSVYDTDSSVVRDTLRDPLQGPLPDKAGYWSRVLRFQLSL